MFFSNCFIYAQHKERACNTFLSVQKLLEILDKKPLMHLNVRDFSKKCNVTDTIEKRLLQLLNPIWDSLEVNRYLDQEVIRLDNWYSVTLSAQKLSNNSDSIFKLKYDSISKSVKSIISKELEISNVFTFNNDLLKLVSYLGLSDAVPIIEKYFLYYNSFDAKLALAKLGNKLFYQEIISKSRFNSKLKDEELLDDFSKKFKNLTFLATQESIFELHNWLQFGQKFTLSSNGAQGEISHIVVGYLRDIISNKDFLEITKSINTMGYCPCSEDSIIKIKNWLIINKGNYIINRSFYPY